MSSSGPFSTDMVYYKLSSLKKNHLLLLYFFSKLPFLLVDLPGSAMPFYVMDE